MEQGKGVSGVIDDHDEQGLESGEALTTDAVVKEGLTALGQKRIEDGEEDEGQEDVSTSGGEGAFGKMAEMVALFELAEGGVFDERTQIVEVEAVERLGDSEGRDEDRLVRESIGFGTPVGDDEGIDRIGAEIGAVESGLVVGIAIGIKGCQFEDPTHIDLTTA